MNDSPRPQKLLAQALPVLVIAAVPLAAFLAFAIQPMMGKRLLPIYGGTSATWLGCMVYFQMALLLGYSWAAWLVRKRALVQMGATMALAAVAVITFHLPADDAVATASIGRVVWRLAIATLPAMVLLFSTSPLLHGWLRRQGEEVPYYLYAISNAGSLLALLLYPFFIETSLKLSDQSYFWHGSLVVVAAVLAIAGYVFKQSAEAAARAATPEPADEPLAPGRVILWLWLSALTCVGMLGATYQIAAEIGSSPLAWVGPFGVYLLAFMVTFAGRWRNWMTLTTIVWLAISLTGYMVTKGFTSVTVNAGTAWWLVSLTASGSFLGNALLHGARPAQRFERYYLVLAVGGVLGGLVSATVIPYLLGRPVEFALASVALLTTGLIWLTARRELSTMTVLACVLVIPVIGLGVHQARLESVDNTTVRHYRDLYGHIMVQTDARSVILSSDTTKHGTQLTMNPAARRHPTLYYSESTGVGRVLERLRAERPAMNVGVIGLGAGTLAAYSRQGDNYDFWDIDPKAFRVARENFTYVAEAAGKINLVQLDGRKALEESKTDYDVLVVDAFTGDGVPSHLLTREAMAVYFRRLTARHGLLVIHASTRYSKLFPVVEATARSVEWTALDVHADISHDIVEPGKERDWDPTPTDYIIVGQPEHAKEVLTWFPDEEEGGRVKYLVTTVQSPLVNSQLIWTDDRNSAIDVLDLGKYLFD
jgi:hypothetical protein